MEVQDVFSHEIVEFLREDNQDRFNEEDELDKLLAAVSCAYEVDTAIVPEC